MKKLFKTIYNIVPFKKEIYWLIKHFIKLPPSVYKHLHFKGFFTVKIDSKNKFKIYHPGTIEENEIFWNGLYHGWEKKSVMIWMQLVKGPNKTIIDVGANTGLYGLVAKCLNPESDVYCFEPLPGVFKTLHKNIIANSYKITAVPAGLSDYNGKAKVYLPAGSEFAYSVTVNQNTLSQKDVDEVEIEVRRLDSFIEEHQIKPIDLMKVDVETHEVEVLNGMGEYLKKFKPTFIIEVLNDDIAEKLNHIFNGMDYFYYNIDDNKNSIRKTEKITKSDHWNYLICSETIAKSLNLI